MPKLLSSFFAGSRLLGWLTGFLAMSAAYLYAFPQPNVFYAVVVVLHALGGLVASVLLLILFTRLMREGDWISRAGLLLLACGAVIGIALIKLGTSRPEWNWFYAHILLSLAGAGLLFSDWMRSRGWLDRGAVQAFARTALVLALLAGFGAAARYICESRWLAHGRIVNPEMPPANMDAEGDGPNGAFFPSSAQIYGRNKIPSKFFMESDSCQRCHQDIYNQWFSSVHHFSSFNNQWYRKSIEYMQDTIGTKPSKWCG